MTYSPSMQLIKSWNLFTCFWRTLALLGGVLFSLQSVAFDASVDDQVKVLGCPTAHKTARGMYTRFKNSRSEWVSYSNKPVYRFINGSKTYQLYFRTHTQDWVLDNNGIDNTSSGIISVMQQQNIDHPGKGGWSNNCLIFPKKIHVNYLGNANASGNYQIGGTNKGVPIYKKGSWNIYYNNKVKKWVVDTNSVSNRNTKGVIAKGTINQKKLFLTKWDKSLLIQPTAWPMAAIDAGYTHTCAVYGDDAKCWGKIDQTKNVPSDNAALLSQKSIALSGPVDVSSSRYHTCFLDNQGAKCWGEFHSINDSGQAPTLKVLSAGRQISAGWDHTCAIDSGGVKCWGNNSHGEAPSSPPSLTSPIAVSADHNFSCAIDANSVKCWGDHPLGASIRALTKPISLATSATQVCTLDDAGLKCWGDFSTAQGAVSNSQQLLTDHGITLTNAHQVILGDDHGCILDSEGPKCWGQNDQGQAPKMLDIPHGQKLTTGKDHTCLVDDQSIRCWGDDTYQQTAVEHQSHSAIHSFWQSPPGTGSGDCLHINSNGKWNAATCDTASYAFSCYDQDSGNWYITQAKAYWYRGGNQCSSEFGSSALFLSPVSELDNQKLQQVISASGESTVWANLSDELHEGTWKISSQNDLLDMLMNPRAEEGTLRAWDYSETNGISDHRYWRVEKNQDKPYFVLNKPMGSADTTRSQVVNLIKQGWTATELSSIPPIHVEQLYTIEPGSSAVLCLNIELLRSDNVVISRGDSENNCLAIENNSSVRQYHTLKDTLTNYPSNVRKIRWIDTVAEASGVGIEMSELRIVNGAQASSQPLARSLSQSSGFTAPLTKINDIKVTIHTGDRATWVSTYFDLATSSSNPSTWTQITQKYLLNKWFNGFSTNSTSSFDIKGYPTSYLEDKRYTGQISLEARYVGSAGLKIQTIEIEFNGVKVFEDNPNVELTSYNYFTGNGGRTYSYDFTLPRELLVHAIPELNNARHEIENALAQLKGVASYELNSDQKEQLLGVYDYFQPLYEQHQNDAAKLAELQSEASKEYLQHISYFHMQDQYAIYENRLNGTELPMFNRMRASLTETLSLTDADAAEYTELARSFEWQMANEFDRIIQKRVCQAQACEAEISEKEVHQALFWADLVYQSEAVISNNIKHGLDAHNVYQSGFVHDFNTDGSWGDTSSQMFLAEVDTGSYKDLVISFRGTNSFGDGATDVNYSLVTHKLFPNSNLKVHKGFQNMWEFHKVNLIDKLDGLLDDGGIDNYRTIYVTGHSLGAATATISMPYLASHLQSKYHFKSPSRLKLINFGSPRSGNREWVSHFNTLRDSFTFARVWNFNDFFQTVPLNSQSFFHIDSSVLLPSVPASSGVVPVWPVNWFSKEYAGNVLNWLYENIGSWTSGHNVVGADIKNHGTDAYKFTVDRNLIDLNIIEHSTSRAENCIAYDGINLKDEPCSNDSYYFLCEELKTITLVKDIIGKDSVKWTNVWTISANTGTWSDNAQVCTGNSKFGVPSRQSDLNEIKGKLNGKTVWVNYIRKPIKE